MGGPAHHVALLSGRLDPERYETLLVTGHVGRGEASLVDLAAEYDAPLRVVRPLGPEMNPGSDLAALAALGRIVRAFQPDIVHTHTAKAGTLGRLAARLAISRPLTIHTYHGHALSRYFGPLRSAVYREIERRLGARTDCLIGVSRATVEDLVRLRIAESERFRVIPIGLDLAPFQGLAESDRHAFREEIAAGPNDVVLSFVGRLVPIKRVDVLLAAVAEARRLGAPVLLALVGDGVLRPDLERLASELGITGSVRFLGYRRDLVRIAAGSDLATLSSDDEGTPVSLIEAAAAGRPAVATDVGGVRDVVAHGTGILAPPRAADALASAMARLAADAHLRARMGAQARAHVMSRFSADRLISDIDALYQELLASAAPYIPARPQRKRR